MKRYIGIFLSFALFGMVSCGDDNTITGTNIIEIESHWVKESIPDIGNNWALLDLDFIDSGSGWAVGTKGYVAELPEGGVILKYDGSTWNEMSLPEVSSNWSLMGIDMISDYEGWAVGGDFSLQDTVRAVILHYNGTNWEKVYPDYNGKNYYCLLNSVSFGASEEGWAVGNTFFNPSGSFVKSGVVLRFRDNEWAGVSSPVNNGYYADCGYYNVVFDSKTDGWFSGYDDVFDVQANLYHFRSSSWLLETSLAAGDYYHIQRIVYDKDGGVWGVGQDQIQISNLAPVGLVIEYTPDGWMALPKFSDPGVPVEFYGIAPIDKNNIWVGGGNSNMYLLWYNGEQWHQVNLEEKQGVIIDIIFPSSEKGWAIGIDYTHGFDDGRGIIYHYDESNINSENP